jgi:predicted aldo/keto reductase-like oxidoreductase
MQYRRLGRTGLNVSEIGYGAEHLVDKPYELVDAVVNAALDGGVNIIDVFMPQPEVRLNIGRAIGKRRKDVLLQGHIGAALMDDGQYLRSRDPEKCEEFVRDFLMRFNTDYIDLGMVHFVDTVADFIEAFDSPYIEYVQKLKKDGVIRFIGASTHDAATGIKMVNTGLIDMVMFSINPAFDLSPDEYTLDMMFEGAKLKRLQIDPVRAEFYNLCAAKGVGITVMKALGAGRLLNSESSALGFPLTLPQCVSYALDRPAVSSVLLGAQTVEEVEQALAYENTFLEERDYAVAIQNARPDLDGKCMYCNHCLPCPQEIDVAAVTKYLDMAKMNDSEIVRSHYDALSAHGGDCIGCGSCEGNCPFKIKVIENMREAARVFGKWAS